ncbi:hypothetical protein RchiOBHm_Chr4g0388391 [Rosa chinensis]|uniref:Uncharacterized protein n=1 Tax=Rosa chinensis TaxID=74649 RepID=A0A2P6QPQ0_ROSCH|nr:hypothetical protein RchiOBHm_Chr4g0388391 [Rosa chinensis]
MFTFRSVTVFTVMKRDQISFGGLFFLSLFLNCVNMFFKAENLLSIFFPNNDSWPLNG